MPEAQYSIRAFLPHAMLGYARQIAKSEMSWSEALMLSFGERIIRFAYIKYIIVYFRLQLYYSY